MIDDAQAEVMEALRRGLNALPRFSFLLDNAGNVRRVPDRHGHWIDWQSAHELFDADMLATLIAKLRAEQAIKRASS
jgi:hypothetical protein